MVLLIKTLTGSKHALNAIRLASQSRCEASIMLVQRRSYSRQNLIKGEKLTGNLELLRAQKSPNKHLALMMVWLAAKRVHLEDYFRFYLDNGFDVLWVRTHPQQLLFPAGANGGQKVASTVLDFISSQANQSYENVMLHSFSIGGYLWGECLSMMRKEPEKYKQFEQSIKAQVFDSCVDVEGIPAGLPFAVVKNPALRAMATPMIWAYLGMAYPFATRHYRNSSNHFRYQPVKAPTIYFNSLIDKVSSPKVDKDVVDGWRVRGVDVKLVTFPDSKHVQHLGKHPDKYTDEIVSLMKRTMPNCGSFQVSDQLKADISARGAQVLRKANGL